MRWRPKDNSKWHKWFAWHPVLCRCGAFVWLETVWRCKFYDDGIKTCEYVVYEERPDICEDGHIPEGTP